MLTIFCDGACSGNPGPGAWAYIVFEGDLDHRNIQNNKNNIIALASGASKDTTNNRMELMAAINAVRAFDNCTIIVDSKYVKDGITSWINKWKINGWKSASGAVKNVDLWQELDRVLAGKKIKWEWQPGHANTVHDLVDQVARNAVQN